MALPAAPVTLDLRAQSESPVPPVFLDLEDSPDAMEPTERTALLEETGPLESRVSLDPPVALGSEERLALVEREAEMDTQDMLVSVESWARPETLVPVALLGPPASAVLKARRERDAL